MKKMVFIFVCMLFASFIFANEKGELLNSTLNKTGKNYSTQFQSFEADNSESGIIKNKKLFYTGWFYCMANSTQAFIFTAVAMTIQPNMGYMFLFTGLPAFVNILGASLIPFAGPFITSFSMFITAAACFVAGLGFGAPLLVAAGANLVISSWLDIGAAILQISSLVDNEKTEVQKVSLLASAFYKNENENGMVLGVGYRF
ncbi:MAG: hypothetical protein A2015_15460 [Spirochaetes bacterium GWF1_31_7]|nr:MAG: hypothetical protein A2Y30_11880 [Spirochaetes bacterium GWE1_32_154]OHD47263.1 MAG: hypothetical protein A2Y29_02895 [Spirochaetes bacterium GWE2_31_10]OHD52135.1 MAG: hypothetical protein A2015_15460 [Spirochaetes bacterium GWF1_31_7]OHD83001.1 MAG: hypothetical protein A2355_10395 [Spirochaetes bacterium RIFOXYB1_FULL_32_8]HBD96319.1 hypothetical protein [Spirochaetia bacterium]